MKPKKKKSAALRTGAGRVKTKSRRTKSVLVKSKERVHGAKFLHCVSGKTSMSGCDRILIGGDPLVLTMGQSIELRTYQTNYDFARFMAKRGIRDYAYYNGRSYDGLASESLP